jgi:hypothetical protein
MLAPVKRPHEHGTRPSLATCIEQVDGALHAVVNDVTFDFEFTPSQIATLLVVHARARAPLRSIDRLRMAAMRRVLVRLQRTLAPEPGSVFRLRGDR